MQNILVKSFLNQLEKHSILLIFFLIFFLEIVSALFWNFVHNTESAFVCFAYPTDLR